MNIPNKPLPIDHIKPMVVPVLNEIGREPLKLYDITHQAAIQAVIDSIPYYLLAYGNNLSQIACLVPQKQIGLAIGLLGKTLSYLAKKYKIEEKKLIK